VKHDAGTDRDKRRGGTRSAGPAAQGTRVQVVVEEAPKQLTLTALLELVGTVDDLPADMARNQDHYIHGAPKR
jgi:hypothetical protein